MASPRRMLIAIHDVGPLFADEVERWVERLDRLTGGCRVAMLVVPDHHRRASLAADPAFARRLRGWRAAGAEMFLHGMYHVDEQRHGSALARLKARHATAGEGEFLGLSYDAARGRLREGRTIVEDAIGAAVAGFVAPAWLYGPAALRALADEDFALAEDHWRVWAPASGVSLARGPVVTWASRTPARALSSRAFAGLARAMLHAQPVVRIGVHPGDLSRPELVASIEATITALSAGREIGRYADLLAPVRAGARDARRSAARP